MPKNLSTVGAATELRFGKNCREDQHDNSVVINASNDKIDATKAGGFYLTPLELSTDFASDGTDATTNTFVAYNQSTKQLFRTQVPMSITGISNAGSGAQGDLNVNGNLYVTGNVTSIGTVANIHVTNSQFKDGLIEIGTNNTNLATFDLGHIYNRPVGSSNVAVCYDASDRELIIAYTDSSPMDNTNQVNPKTNETMNVHVYGKLYTESNVGVANTAPIHSLSVKDKCFIEADGNHPNVLDVRGNTTIEGAIITNTGGVTKKTYSDKNTIASGTTASGAALTLTFTNHPFYAKIVAQLIDNADNEVSTMLIDLAGGERGGDGTPHDIALGPISIFGNASTNPWSSTVAVTQTTVVLTPSTDFTVAANSGEGSYSIFIEYISPDTAGAITSINSTNFGY
jgi:carbonic anhydrase/acetyltransferase-like protein (isoleucine patch superfamily)